MAGMLAAPLRLPASLSLRERRLELVLALASVMIGTTGGWLYLLVHQQEITPLRLVLASLVWCTTGLVLQTVILRLSLQRQLPVLVGWGTALVLGLLFCWLPRLLPPPPGSRPPCLLVLRIFRRGGPMAWLFDHVVQRWRLCGPVLLITAADLASRTLEPHELVAFVEGRLQERYISSAEQLHTQLAQIQHRPDHDGRWRVHEFYCYANSWKPTLDALLSRSDAVLMDLRGFSSRNAGCSHERQRIGQSRHLGSAVLLVDRHTDRVAVDEALDDQPAAAIVLHGAEQRRVAASAAVLASLLRPFPTPSCQSPFSQP
jgi:hypothetical protein